MNNLENKISKSNKWYGILLFAIILRSIMVWFRWPDFLYKAELFASNKFALSNISPSLADFLINLILFAFLISFALNRLVNKPMNRLVFSGLYGAISIFGFWYFLQNLINIYDGSQYVLDLKLNLNGLPIGFKITVFAIIFCLAGTYLLIQIYVVNFLIIIYKSSFEIILFMGVSVFLSIVSSLYLPQYSLLFLTHLLFVCGLFWFRKQSNFQNLPYKFTETFLFVALFFSFAGAFIDHYEGQLADYDLKQKFAQSKLVESDPMGEFLIQIAQENIVNSQTIKNELQKSKIDYAKIDLEIKQKHLKNWFDRYHILVNYFDEKGQNLKTPELENLDTFLKENLIGTENTFIENLFLTKSNFQLNARKYVQVLKLKNTVNQTFTIVIFYYDASQKATKTIANVSEALAYSIFSKNKKILLQIGQIPIPLSVINDPNIFTKPLIVNKIKFSGAKGEAGKFLIMAEPDASYYESFIVFCFLFVVIISIFSIAYLFASLILHKQFKTYSFTAKIQVYFGIAFLLPLVISLILLFNIIHKSYIENATIKIENQAVKIKNEISQIYQNLPKSVSNKYFWERKILELSQNFNVDFSYFDKNGSFIASSLPTMSHISNTILSKYLEGVNHTKTAKIGNNKYIYIANLSDNQGQAIGFLTCPFTLKNVLENPETNQLIGSIIAAFAVVFGIFLLLSIFLSDLLIKPLRLITKYLQNTDLEHISSPISWNSNDEIGLLVKGYNEMLAKLELSKKEISQTEKQSAWQDIAKQVAHEIKNPLTPMKLTLQHMENKLEKNEEIKKESFLKSFKNLIFNINNISDIVDSFMAFARMPMPKNVKMDLLKPLQNVLQLYTNQTNVVFSIEPKLKKAMVLGDEKLLYQIFNNIIINGLQSVSNNLEPKIEIKINKIETDFLVSIADNGAGISEDLKKKIFLPNYTTKVGGSGIGLSLAKWGIENMNGKIFFESKPGIGTTFYIQLPEL